jgi:hypothetical protein
MKNQAKELDGDFIGGQGPLKKTKKDKLVNLLKLKSY